MTIVKSVSNLENYPFVYLGEDLVDSLRRFWISVYRDTGLARPDGEQERALKFLELYADLNDFRVGLNDVERDYFQKFIVGFCEFLKGSSLVSWGNSQKRRLFVHLKHTLTFLFDSLFGDHPEWLSDLEWTDLDAREVTESDLDQDKLLYWSGWPLVTRKNQVGYLDLSGLYHSHGKEFTVTFYSRWRSYFAKQARVDTPPVNFIARFLAAHPEDWPPSTFDDPLRISRFFKALLRSYFLRAHNEGLNLPVRIKAWNTMASRIDQAFFQPGVWPEPFGSGIPRVDSPEIPGANTRISKNADGVEVHNKLITEVPIQYTDDQAIEVIFNKIHTDLKLIERWAKNQARDLRRRQLRRVIQSRSGQIVDLPFSPKSIEEIGFDNLCAIFEHYGFGTLDDELFRGVLGHRNGKTKISKSELAYELGMPLTNSLFPFMLLLVINNPDITPTFLKDLDLFNEKGQLSGFVKDDAGYHLTGYKDRRGKALSEMKVFLSPRSASLVRQVIEITNPLRKYLKDRGDVAWRKLFLTSGLGWAYPRAGAVPAWNRNALERMKSKFDDLKRSFSRFTDMTEDELLRFLSKITLGSVRATRGVQIYLETKSVEEMARALGHASYRPDLLNHYLPPSILAFFQTRWIRIFQRAFICEALKDSPYLMQATGFESMQELHEFLKNHALKNIPSHLSDPEQIADSRDPASSNDHVLISVDQGILSALLSLNHAVEQSQIKHQISGLARYWSNISQLIEKEIQEGSDALLKEHLTNAREHTDPKKMEGLIYDTAE